MKKLPIGIQDFGELIKGQYLYVDKTPLIHQLLDQGKYFFLARPRRFGKSLLISTLRDLFQGKKTLFQGLWIEDQHDWEQVHPVLHISFNGIGYQELGLQKAILLRLDELAQVHGIVLQSEGVSKRFAELIRTLSATQKVVLLIDEYDKPVIDYVDNLPQAEENKQILRNFYSVIKESDPFLRFVFITGVSKFSKISIFSDLNNLNDITIDARFSALGGYTQQELEANFEENINALYPTLQISRSELMEEIRDWYNGYSWTGPQKVYNPFSILNFFSKGVFQNFWFTTGTPTFLINILKQGWNYQLDELEVGSSQLDFFDIAHPDYRSLLFQTGYLTIKSQVSHNIYSLGYPNKEVKDSMLQFLIGAFSFQERGDAAPTVLKLKKALDKAETALFVSILNSLFASIPENIFRQRNEAAYHAVVYTSLSLMGFYIESQVAAGDGYVDAVVKTAQNIFVLEFKVGYPAAEAIAQIRKKGYAEPYRHDGRNVLLLGISFGLQSKGVQEWIEEAL